jgi:hypothetical protein
VNFTRNHFLHNLIKFYISSKQNLIDILFTANIQANTTEISSEGVSKKGEFNELKKAILDKYE